MNGMKKKILGRLKQGERKKYEQWAEKCAKKKKHEHLMHKRTYIHRSNNPINSSHTNENVHIDKIHNEYSCFLYYEW